MEQSPDVNLVMLQPT